MSDTNIPNLPEEFQAMRGVVMNAPPQEVLAQTNTMIRDAVAQLGKDERGVLTWIATTEGVNLALVQKVNDHVEVFGYVGKSWGKPLAAGIAARLHW